MKRQAAAFLLTIVVFATATTPIASARSVVSPLGLTFNGTTATCTFTVTQAASDINVAMTLWQGSTLVESWTEQSTDMVVMNEKCTVSKGKDYTLKVSYTIDGKAMPEQSVTKSN